MRRSFVLTLFLLTAAWGLSACNEFERTGRNPKPFNSPASWEYRPYGEQQFQN